MDRFACPYLRADVELSRERGQHIAERHPDLLPEHFDLLTKTVAQPDRVRRSKRFAAAKLFSRWFPELRGGKHIVVVVVNDLKDSRYWIITAYIAGRLAEGEIEWQRS
jgi:hypothetical protein